MSESKRDRDRATEAFRRWARAGCPGPDQIRDGKGAEDLRACVAVFAALEEKRAERYRKNFPAFEIMEAVRLFTDGNAALTKALEKMQAEQ